MTKKLMMNKPSNIIEDYNKWFQIYELSGAFNTIEDGRIDEEGRIYIDEIWGNTWQDSGSKNLFDPNQELTVGLLLGTGVIDTGSNRVDYRTSDYIQIKPSTTYAIRLGTFDNRVGFYDKDKEFIDYYKLNSSTFTTPQNCVYIRTSCLNMFENVQLNEGSVLLEYDEYRKPDLSNIQHVGELVSVEGGGQEQYKVEIEIGNGYSNIEIEQGIYYWNNGTPNKRDTVFRSKEMFLDINLLKRHDILITFNNEITKTDYQLNITFYDKDRNFINKYFDGVIKYKNNHGYIANIDYNKIPSNVRYFRFSEYRESIYPQNSIELLGIRAQFCPKNIININYIPHRSHKQTILLPCQLMKVGDVRDRLYWDVDEGKYMIEKNIGFITRNSNNNYRVMDAGKENVIIFECTDIVSDVKQPSAEGIATVSNLIKSCRTDTWNSDSEGIHFMNGGSKFRIKINKSRLDPLDSDGLKDFILKNGDQIRLYYHLQTPELIKINITERIELPCYNPTTHIIVNSGNIEPSNVKAVVPMKASVVTDGLVCWLDGRDYRTGDRVWIDRSINKNNFRATGLSINSKGAIYCQSNIGCADCILETPKNYTIEVNCYYESFEQISYLWAFGDHSIGHHHDYLWNYPNGNSLSLRRANVATNTWVVHDNIYNLIKMKNCIITVTFDYQYKLAILYVDGVKLKELSFTLDYKYTNNNYVILMNRGLKNKPFNNGGIYSYKIYNRVLTEKEIEQNYLYEKLIQRGDD